MIPFSGLLFFYLLFLGLLPAVVLGLLGKKLHYYGIFLCQNAPVRSCGRR